MLKFWEGQQLNVEYTPVADVAAGEAVQVGAEIWVAPSAIAANELGTLDAGRGIGVYKIPKQAGAGVTFALGAEVEIDVTNQRAVAATAGDADFGFAVEAAGDDDEFVLVRKG